MLFVAVGLLVAQAAAQACFYPDGNRPPADFVCNPTSAVSGCCAQGYTCDSFGTCRYPGGRLFRGSCTDASWDSNCPQWCLKFSRSRDQGIELISCANVTGSDLDRCCVGDAGCCDSGIGRFRLDGSADSPTILSRTATAISTATRPRTTTTRSTTTRSSTSSSSSARTTIHAGGPDYDDSSSGISLSSSSSRPKLKKGAKIGIGVGVSLGTVLAGLLLACCLRKRKGSKMQESLPQAPGGGGSVGNPSTMEPKLDYTQPLNMKS